MEPIEAALAAIELLGPGEETNYTHIAKTYGVVQSMLTRRYQCVTASCSTEAADQQALPSAGARAAQIYQTAHRTRLTTYKSNGITIRVIYCKKRAWKRLS
jgi:hypothetical protein